MLRLNYVDFVKEIKNRVENVYRVTGDDVFLLSQIETKCQAACEIQFEDFDKSSFDLENFTPASFENAYMQLPIQANKRMIVVKNIAKLLESDKKKILEILSRTNSSATVLFFANQEGEDFSFLKDAVKVDCQRLSPSMCESFIADKVKKLNTKITKEAAEHLIELTLRHLGRIDKELNKLAILVVDKGIIEIEDVKISVKQDLEYQIYEISDLLISKKLTRAMQIVGDLLSKKEEPTTILSMLTSNFRRLYFAKISPDDNATLSRQLGVKEFAIKIARDKQAKIGAMALKNINEMLLETDYMIKSGKMPADLALNYAMLKINSLIK